MCPVPETIRDAVLLRTAGLSPEGRAAAEAAAVAGAEFGLDLVAGLDELLETGLVAETEPGRAAFRHALVRGAIYEDIQWLRRRELHAPLAEQPDGGRRAERRDRRPLARRRRPRAARSTAFLAAAASWPPSTPTATRRSAALQALDLWPEGTRPAERLAALDAYAHSAELAGDVAEAARALREAVTRAQRPGRDARPRPSGASPRSTTCRATATAR